MGPTGVVCGLRVEADCLAGHPQLRIGIAGARPGRATAVAGDLVAAGCGALISFGTAGGLAPGLAPGCLVVADRVLLADGRSLAVDVDWRRRLVAACGAGVVGSGVVGRGVIGKGVVGGAIAAVTEPLLDPEAKAACHRARAAVACDMESGPVALVAAAAGLPFLVVRAIADPADRAVPAWAMACIAEDGATRAGPALAALARRPATLPALLRLAFDSRRALRTLARIAPLLAPPMDEQAP